MHKILYLLLILLTISFSIQAQNTGWVFGPAVNEGHRSFQYRATIDPDNSQNETGFAQRLHYQQAINSDFMWRVIGQTRKNQTSDFDFDFIQAELFWQLKERANYQSGVRFDLKVRDGDRPDQFGFNWMHQYQLNDEWYARALLLTSLQLGSNAADGVFFQTRASIWKKTAFANLGLELFNSYGSSDDFKGINEQSHSIGPFLSKSVGSQGWSIFLGSLHGLTDVSADFEARFWLTKSL